MEVLYIGLMCASLGAITVEAYIGSGKNGVGIAGLGALWCACPRQGRCRH